jgi:hypothetical protein
MHDVAGATAEDRRTISQAGRRRVSSVDPKRIERARGGERKTIGRQARRAYCDEAG